jgi:hypothetical protein
MTAIKMPPQPQDGNAMNNPNLTSLIVQAGDAGRKGQRVAPELRSAAEYVASIEDANDRQRAREILSQLVASKTPPEDVAAELRSKALPLDVDFNAAPPPPRYVIGGIAERQTVSVWAGDGGSAKSTAAQAAAMAAVTGTEWLGRVVDADRVLYLDEENPQRVPHARLRALGMTNEGKSSLRYFSRQGIVLGTDEWDRWLRAEIVAERPDLVFIDGAAAATAVEVNDNDSVTKLLNRLRALASEFDCAIVLLHHARKPSLGQSDDGGMGTMGARAWHNQADAHLTFKQAGPFESSRRKDGGDDTRREFTLRGHKDRMDGEAGAELIVLSSGRTASKALEWMRLESGGPVATRQEEMAAGILEFAREHGGEFTPKEAADAVGEDAEDATFRRALKRLHTGQRPRLEKPSKGRYTLVRAETPEGGLSV